MKAISVNDLRRLSAGAIRALPHAVPITEGGVLVGVLVPVPNISADRLRTVMAEIEAAAAARSPEENAAIDALLAERGVD